MRYYRLTIEKQNGQKIVYESGLRSLNLAFDFQVFTQGVAQLNAPITIYGLGIDEIKTALEYFGAKITLTAGFVDGLPLATISKVSPQVIVTGFVFDVFGNYSGGDRSLTFIVVPNLDNSNYITAATGIIEFKEGVSVVSSIKKAVGGLNKRATFVLQGQDRPSPRDAMFQAHGLVDLRQKVSKQTTVFFDGNYRVDVFEDPKKLDNYIIHIADRSGKTGTETTKQVNQLEYIGMPVYTNIRTLEITLCLRPDLTINDIIIVNIAGASTNASAFSVKNDFIQKAKDVYSLNASVKLLSVRHRGIYREADGKNWSTVVEGVLDVDMNKLREVNNPYGNTPY